MSTNTSLSPSVYGSHYGSMYFAVVLSTVFYGVTCMQTFFYYVHYPVDPSRSKFFVAVLWALNTIHEALSVAAVYKYILAGLLNSQTYQTIVPELIVQMLLTVLVAILAQGFFVYRIYMFSRKNIIAPILWVCLAIIELVTIVVFLGKSLYSANGSVHVVARAKLGESSFTTVLTLNLSTAAAVDILIATFLTVLLLHQRAATSIASTATILQRLTVFAVNTAIWPATCALLIMVLLHVRPFTLLYTIFGIPLCSIYCNTVLAHLNARAYLRGEAVIHSVNLDLFEGSSFPVFVKTTKSDEQSRDPKMTTSVQGVWTTGSLDARASTDMIV